MRNDRNPQTLDRLVQASGHLTVAEVQDFKTQDLANIFSLSLYIYIYFIPKLSLLTIVKLDYDRKSCVTSNSILRLLNSLESVPEKKRKIIQIHSEKVLSSRLVSICA